MFSPSVATAMHQQHRPSVEERATLFVGGGPFQFSATNGDTMRTVNMNWFVVVVVVLLILSLLASTGHLSL